MQPNVNRRYETDMKRLYIPSDGTGLDPVWWTVCLCRVARSFLKGCLTDLSQRRMTTPLVIEQFEAM